MSFTKDKYTHGQTCCDQPLVSYDDYSGGGSHYWYLKCKVCKKVYEYDTYSFELRQIIKLPQK